MLHPPPRLKFPPQFPPRLKWIFQFPKPFWGTQRHFQCYIRVLIFPAFFPQHFLFVGLLFCIPELAQGTYSKSKTLSPWRRWKNWMLFNRFAQAAGPGLNAPSDEGKKGMKGWRGGSMNGWGKKAWKDEGANGWKDEGKNGWMGAGTEGKMDKRIQGWREECMKGWREKSIHGCRKEGKNERMKRRRDRSHKWAKRARTIKHRPQNLQKKGTEIDQNGAKIDPKGSQNEAKTDKKSEQRLQDDLGPLWGAIFRLSPRS